MALSAYELERRAADIAEIRETAQAARLDAANLTRLHGEQDRRIDHATTVAYVAMAVGGLFGLVDFGLLLLVLSRLGGG